MKDYARGFYQSKAWKATQKAYMVSQHYICERCGGPARVVHHIRHITPGNIGDANITLSWDNLEALCMDCHNDEHISASNTARARPAIAEGLCFDNDGNLVQGDATPPA